MRDFANIFLLFTLLTFLIFFSLKAFSDDKNESSAKKAIVVEATSGMGRAVAKLISKPSSHF